MTDLIQAMVYTIQKFVSMFFTLNIDNDVSIGGFMLATAILGALIRLIFSVIHVPGGKFAPRGSSSSDDLGGSVVSSGIEDKGGKWKHNVN